MELNLIFYILGCLLLILFFAASEVAFASADRLSIELKKKQGTFSGGIMGRFFSKPAEFIGTSLIGINVSLVIYVLLISQLTDIWTGHAPAHFRQFYVKVILDVFIAVSVILIAAQLLPNTIFRTRSSAVLSVVAFPMQLMRIIFYPIAKIFIAISAFILKYLFNVRIKDDKEVFTRVNMENFVKQTLYGHEAENNDMNSELFENALDLVKVKARKCMIPRNEVIGVNVEMTVEAVREKFIETKLSKIVVYEKDLDEILGYLHHLDLLKKPATIREVLHSISAVPETMNAVDLISRFTKERKSIAWVIDEFGGTAGIVTMEDVLEEIFGDIHDEYDTEEYVEKQISENEYIFSGRLELDHLNSKYGFNFPTDGTETLSGYIIQQYKTIPKNKVRIIIGLYEFDILLVSDTRIETVKMKVLKPL